MKERKKNLPNKTTIFIIIIILALIGVCIYGWTRPKYPTVVIVYQERYKQMNTPEYKQSLLEYTGLSGDEDYLEVLDFMRTKIRYPDPNNNPKENSWLNSIKRAELPIEIMKQIPPIGFRTNASDTRAVGRCGEFSLLYTGLLLATNHQVRLIIDCSYLTDSTTYKAAGDHVWVEVWTNQSIYPNRWYVEPIWIHIDPTEGKIDQPWLYGRDWEKEINLVYAVTDKEIENVTERYKYWSL